MVRKYKLYCAIVILSIFFAIFSVDTHLYRQRYVDIPIEILSVIGLLALPFLWKKDLWMFLFLVSVLFSSFVSGSLASGIRYIAIASFGYYFLPYIFYKGRKPAKLVLNTLNVIGMALVIVVLINLLCPPNTFDEYYANAHENALPPISDQKWLNIDVYHAYPFTGSKLSTGFIFSLIVWANMPYLLNRKERKFSLLMVVLSVFMIIMLEARAPLFSVFATALYFMYKLRQKSLLPLLLSILLLGSGLFIVSKYKVPYEDIYNRYLGTSPFESLSFVSRMVSWRNYLLACKNYPFGVGYERSSIEFSHGKESWRFMLVPGAHSEFLKLLVELGWFPFLLFLGKNMTGLMLCLRIRLWGERDKLKMMICCMFITLFPQFVVNTQMQQPEVSVLYWFILGVLLLYNRR